MQLLSVRYFPIPHGWELNTARLRTQYHMLIKKIHFGQIFDVSRPKFCAFSESSNIFSILCILSPIVGHFWKSGFWGNQVNQRNLHINTSPNSNIVSAQAKMWYCKLPHSWQSKFSTRGYTPLCFVPPLVENLLCHSCGNLQYHIFACAEIL